MLFQLYCLLQFIDRLILFFQPRKYQPDVPYIRHVQLWRIHMFTLIQILCLVLLWIVKSIKAISIAFPLLVSIEDTVTDGKGQKGYVNEDGFRFLAGKCRRDEMCLTEGKVRQNFIGPADI